jgi:hypothetical protein
LEIWRDIKSFPGYQVSNYGRVRSFINNRYGVCDEWHILKPTINKHGYRSVCLGRGNRRLVSRLVAEAFIPNPNNLPLVRHLDDDPSNNQVHNLAWGTQTDNMQDCVRHGRLVGNTGPAIETRKKRVLAVSLDGTESIEFSSMSEAARVLGVWPQHVTNVVYGRIRQTGGWTFKLLDEEGLSWAK